MVPSARAKEAVFIVFALCCALLYCGGQHSEKSAGVVSVETGDSLVTFPPTSGTEWVSFPTPCPLVLKWLCGWKRVGWCGVLPSLCSPLRQRLWWWRLSDLLWPCRGCQACVAVGLSISEVWRHRLRECPDWFVFMLRFHLADTPLQVRVKCGHMDYQHGCLQGTEPMTSELSVLC